MSSIIAPRDRANFAELINAKLDSIPIHNQGEARTAAAALGSLIGRGQPQEIPPPLLERITDIRDLMNDPLSVGDPSLYPNGQLQQYQQIAMERIPAKIQELLSLSPSDIEREEKRLHDQRSTAERDQEYLRTRQPPTGEASTISEAEWLRQQQEEFQREAHPGPVREPRRRDLEGAINLGDLPPLGALEEVEPPPLGTIRNTLLGLVEFIRLNPAALMGLPQEILIIQALRPALIAHLQQHVTDMFALPAEIQSDPALRPSILEYLRQNPGDLCRFNSTLYSLPDFRPVILEDLRRDPIAIWIVPRDMRHDPDISESFLESVRQHPDRIRALPPEIQSDPAFALRPMIMERLKQNPDEINAFPVEVTSDPAILQSCLEGLNRHPEAIIRISYGILESQRFHPYLVGFFRQHPGSINDLPPHMRNDPEFR